MHDDHACPYCDLAELRRNAFVLENDHCLLSIKPSETGALEGAGIIVPKAHRPTVFELTTQEWAATQDLLMQARGYLDAVIAPDGYNAGWNVGAVGGQHVMHAHFHVIRIPFISPTIRNVTGLPAPRPEPVSLLLAPLGLNGLCSPFNRSPYYSSIPG